MTGCIAMHPVCLQARTAKCTHMDELTLAKNIPIKYIPNLI